MSKIVIINFQHETNVFGATPANFHRFEIADPFPRLLRSTEVFHGIGPPTAGPICQGGTTG